ncbi:MAG: DUF898 domain-containing protein [Chitinispirillales bacterium]|nr:DUF898 domain-containing protein [Chitinispirillales bacterium]
MTEEASYFDGGVLQFLGWVILGSIITTCTLGLCLPWAVCMFYKWETSHTVVGGRRLQFNGSGGSLFGHYILWWFLTIITLGIYSFWLYVAMKKWMAKNTSFAG